MAIPVISSIGVSAVTENGASVYLVIEDPGEDEITSIGFRYGVFGGELTEVEVEYIEPGLHTAVLSPLLSDTTYYFVGFASTIDGTGASGTMEHFTTNTYDLLMKSYPSAGGVKVTEFSEEVPFYRACTICQVGIETDSIIISPLVTTAVGKIPIPGATAIYRLRGDGTNSPTFSHAFKKTKGSEEYDTTLGAVNLVRFLYDGVDFWYTIYVEDSGPM